jgi:HemY protein
MAYARAEPSQVKRRLEKAEAWVQSRPNDAELLAAVGHLCLVGQIWGQAENYLSRSLSKRADARVHVLLGSLYDKLNRPQEAAAQWRLATAVGTALPVFAVDAFLPSADTTSDPGVLHAEGLSYLAESGFPANWDQEPPLESAALKLGEASHTDASRDNFEEYFDSAPVMGLGEPAPVSSLPPLPEKKA